MREEGYVFDADHAARLKQAFDLALERLRIDAADHDVKKRLARTLLKIAKHQLESASPEELAGAVVDRACHESAPPDPSAWLTTLRRTPTPTVVPWHLVQKLRSKRVGKRPD